MAGAMLVGDMLNRGLLTKKDGQPFLPEWAGPALGLYAAGILFRDPAAQQLAYAVGGFQLASHTGVANRLVNGAQKLRKKVLPTSLDYEVADSSDDDESDELDNLSHEDMASLASALFDEDADEDEDVAYS